MASTKDSDAREMAVSARECSRRFQVLRTEICLFIYSPFWSDLFSTLVQNLSSEERKKILLDVANALEANEKLIIAENEADVVAAKLAGYEKALISRLTLKPGKASICFFLHALFYRDL